MNRIFRDLLNDEHCYYPTHQCRCGRFGAWKYSTRHYICGSCGSKRCNEVLPRIRKREAFKARMDALKKVQS